uniref:Uncharacterized protein n=1 Tax=Hucho hucho TaxID=62062 RepID=A0A4W5L4Z5_9TELE
MEEEEAEGEVGENGENMTEEEGVDLSSINTMLSTVMNAGQLNGALEPSTPSTPAPRPPSVNLTAYQKASCGNGGWDYK